MSRVQYWLINAASVFVALLIGLEIRSVHQLDHATELAAQAQVPLLAAQQEAPQLQRLIQRTALGATRDPALKDLLARYGLTIRPVAEGGPAPPVTTASSSP